MPSTMPTHARALDALEASVNSILLQTGSAFCDPANYDSWKITRTSTQLKHTLPSALSNFHDALDELERELIRARAVLHRDFTNSRLRQSPAASQDAHPDLSPLQDALVTDISMNEAPQPPTDITNVKDFDSLEKLPKTDTTSIEAHAKSATNGEATRSQGVLDEPLPGVAPSSASSNVLDSKVSKSEDGPVETNDTSKITTEETKPMTFANTPSNGNTALPSASNDYYTHDDVFGSTPNTANMTPNDHLLSAVDVNSLLPGLEYYANGNSTGGEGSFDGFVNLSNSAPNDFMLNEGTNSAQSLPTIPMDDLIGSGDTSNMNFDDLFASFGGDTNSAMGGQTQGLGDTEDTSFDESFFNLDPS